MTVTGTFRHSDPTTPMSSGASCQARQYPAGTPVEITDTSGTLLGSSVLGSGTAMVDSGTGYGAEGYATDCVFTFTMPDIATGKSGYQLTVAGHPNGLVYSEQEMRNSPGIVSTS
jgi:hypothetical protein